MVCLTDKKIQSYLDGALSSVENAMIRDHFIACKICQQSFKEYEKIEKSLDTPIYYEPPKRIENHVMKRLYPVLVSYASVFSVFIVSFMLMVAGIYIYFDFANNSLIQSLKATSHSAFNWLGSIVKFISSVFSFIYATFKAMNRFIQIIFKINVGVEVIGLTVSVFCILVFFFIFKLFVKKNREYS